jgi:3-oxoacyl-[acyl-carrier-protein] synthase II
LPRQLPERARVVITGIGAVSPNAIGAEAFAAACRDGVSGIAAPVGVHLESLRTSALAQVRDFDPCSVMDSVDVRRVPRMIPLALAASREALVMAGLVERLRNVDEARRIGVALGTGGGGMSFIEDQYRSYFVDGRASLVSITAGTHGNLSSELSIALGLRGPSHVISTGCTSSSDAIGYSSLLIRSGVTPMMLTGGADAPIASGILAAFERMKVISTRRWDDPSRASRPFDRDRDGFVLGEGAWMFVLEDREHALARGATILAEVAGYGSTCDAYHRVQIAPDVAEPIRAIALALDDAGVDRD